MYSFLRVDCPGTHTLSQYYSTEEQMSEQSVLFIAAVVGIAGNYVLVILFELKV